MWSQVPQYLTTTCDRGIFTRENMRPSEWYAVQKVLYFGFLFQTPFTVIVGEYSLRHTLALFAWYLNVFCRLHRPNLVSKNFPFTGGGGVPSTKNFFSQSEHVSSQIWCQKIFPLLGGGRGGSLNKNFFFSSLNMYQAKSGVKNFSLYGDQDPPPPEMWTDWNYYLPPSFRWWAVTRKSSCVNARGISPAG